MLSVAWFVVCFVLVWLGPVVRDIYYFSRLEKTWSSTWLYSAVQFDFACAGILKFCVWHGLVKASLLSSGKQSPKSLLAHTDVPASLIHTLGEPEGMGSNNSSILNRTGGDSMYSVVLDSSSDSDNNEMQYEIY